MENQFSLFFIAVLLFTFVFLVVHIVHFRFFKPSVVLKAATQDCSIAIIVGLLLILALPEPKFSDTPFVLFASAMSFALATLLYASLVPTMIDRSLSVFLLITLRQNTSSPIPVDTITAQLNLAEIMQKRYVEMHLSKAASLQDGHIQLTPRGKRIADFFYMIKSVLNMKWNF